MERTLFFIKPDCKNPGIDKATALEVIAFLEDKLRFEGEFTRIHAERTGPMPKEFWLEFYEPIKEIFPGYEAMCGEFAGKSIALFVYEGEKIAERVKTISGPTQYRENVGTNSIRAKFGSPDMGYRTVVHASNRNDVKRELKVFKKYGLLKDLK